MSIEKMLKDSVWNKSDELLKAELPPLNAITRFLKQQEMPKDLDAAKRAIEAAQALLIQKITQYRQSSTDDRQCMLERAQRELKSLSQAVGEATLGQRAIVEMMVVLNRNFLTYIDLLHRAEMGPDYVERLKASGVENPVAAVPFQFDFLGMKDSAVWQDESFSMLHDYFEWQFPVGILPKTPLSEIPDEVWLLFQQAQRNYLKSKGFIHLYQLDPQVAKGEMPAWGIYSRIQAFGATDNLAVDSPQIDADGRVVVAEKFGKYRLPGGGQLEVEYYDEPEAHIPRKIFDEVLEERFAELFRYAAEDYNKVDAKQFDTILVSTLSNDLFSSIEGISSLIEKYRCVGEYGSNADKLAHLIGDIDRLIEAHKEQPASELQMLRASLQVELFKLTEAYPALFEAFSRSDNMTIFSVCQIADVRGHASKQTAYTVMTLRHPVEILMEKYSSMPEVAGDDMVGTKGMKSLSPAQYVASAPDFSHDLTAWAASLVARALGRVTEDGIRACLAPADLQAALKANLNMLESTILPVVRPGVVQSSREGGLLAAQVDRDVVTGSEMDAVASFAAT